MSARKKNKEAVRGLILRVKNNEKAQKAAVLDFLTKKAGIDEAEAKKRSKKIVNERKFLFRNLISVLLDKNLKALVELEDDLSRITNQYHSLEIAAPSEVANEDASAESEESVEKIDELKQEIKGLKHEVHITLTTLNNIFSEFSSMFGEEVPDSEMSVDQIITAMESFSGKTNEESDTESAVVDEAEAFEEEPDAFDEELDAFAEEPDAFSEAEESDSQAEPDPAPETSIEAAVELEDEKSPSDDTDNGPIDRDDKDEFENDPVSEEAPEPEETLDFSIDKELDDIDSALDELELGVSEDDEPSWDEAFEESGDKKSSE